MVTGEVSVALDSSCLFSVAGLREAYAARLLSPVDVVRHAFAQIHAHNPALNAIYEMDEQAALQEAARSENRWDKGTPRGALDGIPTTVKDALALKSFHSFRGTAAEDPTPAPSASNAPCVARMLEAGAIMLGKTTMCDLGILPSGTSSRHGVTRNPWDSSRSPGGSSSGAACAVAAGMHPFAIGTDIVGSIRLPAAFCGLFGFKPSQGRVPYYVNNSPSLVAGPLTHSVRDAAELMNVIARPDRRDFTALAPVAVDYVHELQRPPTPGTIGIVRNLGFDVCPDVAAIRALERAAQMLRDRGWRTVDIAPAFTQGDLAAAQEFYRVRAYAELQTKPAERRRLATVVDQWSASAVAASASDFYNWFLILQQCRDRAITLMHGIDQLLLPATLTTALPAQFPSAGTDPLFAPWAQTYLFNLSEQPAAAVPVQLTAEGLPVAVQIVGQRHDDVGVLRLSAALEECRGPFPLSPPARQALSEFQTAHYKHSKGQT